MSPIERLGKVGIICAGGGYKVASLVGYLTSLAEHDVMPSYIAGVSASALTLAPLSEAQNLNEFREILENVRKRWAAIEAQGSEAVFDTKKAHFWKTDSLFPNNNVLFELVSDFHPDRSIASPITFEFFATNQRTGKKEKFSNRDERFKNDPELLRKAIVASASLLPFFPSLQIGDGHYTDGGAVAIMPSLNPDYELNTIFALYPHPKEYRPARHQKNGFWWSQVPWLPILLDDYSITMRQQEKAELTIARMWLEKERLKRMQGSQECGHSFKEWLERLFGGGDETPDDADGSQRIIPLYADIPQTLDVHSFNKEARDITKSQQKTKLQMDAALAALLA